jgi:acetyl-CoA acetyltransferase
MSRPLARRIVVVDSEVSDFGRHQGHGAVDCAATVAEPLLARNGDLAARVDLIVAGAGRVATSDGIASGLAQLIGARVGLAATPGVEVHAFCASSNAAVHEAAFALEAGRADVALVVGVEHLMSTLSGPLVPDGARDAGAQGFSPPVFYGMCAERYLHDTDATVEALAAVAVRNRQSAASNPHARYRDPITVDDVLESRMIAEPLTFLQCCPPADGAGALLLAAADVVDDADAHVQLIGLGRGSADPERAELTSFSEDVDAARRAFAMAGIEPGDIDVAEVHDAFTIAQLIHLEDTGLCARGEAWRHALDDDPRPVVNPSGGLLSRGHPLGATGIAQFDSIRRYLRTTGRYGFIQEAGGLRPLGQILSECAVLAAPAVTTGGTA